MTETRKEPKKARTVEIDSSKPLSFEEYDELLRHARNSSMWYVGRFPSHSTKLRKRLYEKGYPREDVTHYDLEDELVESNIVDETMAELELLHMLDDANYIEGRFRTFLARGKGLDIAAREMIFGGIPEDEVLEVRESLEGELSSELDEAVQRAAEKIMRSTPFRKAERSWQKSMVLSGGLRAKGFDRDTVDFWMESNSEIFED